MPDGYREGIEGYLSNFIPEGGELIQREISHSEGIAFRTYAGIDINGDKVYDYAVHGTTQYDDSDHIESQFMVHLGPMSHMVEAKMILELPIDATPDDMKNKTIEGLESILKEMTPDSTKQVQPDSSGQTQPIEKIDS